MQTISLHNGLAGVRPFLFQRQGTQRRNGRHVLGRGIDRHVQGLLVNGPGFPNQTFTGHDALLGKSAHQMDDDIRLFQAVVLPADPVLPDNVKEVAPVPCVAG